MFEQAQLKDDTMCRGKLKKTLKKDMKPKVANNMHVVQSLRKRQSWEASWRTQWRGSCVFLVEEWSFRALTPVDTLAALGPLCETLWHVSVGTAFHTSWWEPSGRLIHKICNGKDVNEDILHDITMTITVQRGNPFLSSYLNRNSCTTLCSNRT